MGRYISQNVKNIQPVLNAYKRYVNPAAVFKMGRFVSNISTYQIREQRIFKGGIGKKRKLIKVERESKQSRGCGEC